MWAPGPCYPAGAACPRSTIATPTLVAAHCKDTKGKYTKCPSAAVAAAGGVFQHENGKDHVASQPKKGQFTKCP